MKFTAGSGIQTHASNDMPVRVRLCGDAKQSHSDYQTPLARIFRFVPPNYSIFM
ncbi:MAG: hypothetical protein K8F24_07835 [Bacteroidales bacterium]|nr:hypothetical protein [Bacteroidales bacterium]